MKKPLVHLVVWIAFTTLLVLPGAFMARGQQAEPVFYYGVDLSYVNEMEDCGAVYRENGVPVDPFALFAEHGATLVRARLWVQPDWTHYSTLDDVIRTFTRARSAGMATLLDMHYSDTWADAGTQEIPPAWQNLDDAALADAVYQYTADVFAALESADLVPAFVQIGNETNSGILRGSGAQNWSHDALIFNAGIRAVRDFSATSHQQVKILLHIAQPENTTGWFTQAEAAGITDFDVIGISYYPQWSTYSIADMGAQVTALRQRFGKDVMVLETGYPWTQDAVAETASNVLTQGLRGYPLTPEGQHRFMTDLTQTLISNGAIGVVYWEPAWVSTHCSTRWGQGSHWENATFFDFHNQDEVLEGIHFLSDPYIHPDVLVDGVIEPAYGAPLVADGTGDVLDAVPALDLIALYMRANAGTLSFALTTAGDVFSRAGNYLVYFDTTHDAQGADVDVGQRPITVADPFKPEFRLDISIQQAGGTSRGSYALNAWIDSQWQAITFTGGAAIVNGEPSVIEVELPLALIGSPHRLNIAVVSSDRGRIRGASDILGTSFVPTDSSASLILDQFFRFDLPG